MTDEKLYRVNEHGIAVACAWCPNSKEATAQAEADGYRVSHDCCISCRERLMTR